jgi:hypothetical protein
MTRYLSPEVSPPRSDSSRAGDTEVVSMSRDRSILGTQMRRAGIACLWAAFLLGAASLANARTRPLDYFPDQSGDPTADDQPSPAPKKSAAISLSVAETGGGAATGTVANHPDVRFVWLMYARALIRIAIR